MNAIGVDIDTLTAEEQISVGSRLSHMRKVPKVKRRMNTERENEQRVIVKEKANRQQSGFDPSKEFDFAIIGWPKTGEYNIMPEACSGNSTSHPYCCFFLFFVRHFFSTKHIGRASRSYYAQKGSL